MAELSKAYEPAAVEAKWYARWLAEGFFVADPASPKPAYSIVMPPPNVTGVLTLGHVLNNTIQDILARRARMLGQGSALAAGNGSRRDCDANRGGTTVAQGRRDKRGTISDAKNSFGASGSGRKNTAASSSSN